MTADLQLAVLTAYLEAHPPAPRRPLSAAEIAAEDYWEGVAESRRDEALLPMSEADEAYRQRSYDDYLEREWCG